MPDELFFLFIASSIGLWLIQLVTEWIDRRRESRRIQTGTVTERYRGHLILARAHQEPDTDGWSATPHIQFNEKNLTFRDVQLRRPTSHFPTKTTAEKQAVKEAKLWIDERLRKVEKASRMSRASKMVMLSQTRSASSFISCCIRDWEHRSRA